MLKNYGLIAALVLGIPLVGCSSSSSSSSSLSMSDAIGFIEDGVAATGSGLAGSPLMSAKPKGTSVPAILATTPWSSAMCGDHGVPTYAQSDVQYPYAHTYCAMTVNDGDTVRGGFSLAKGLICALQKGGIEFNGVPQSITISGSDTECWPDGPPGGDTSATFVLSATGSAPASFNTHFEKGVIFSVAEIGLTFKIAANLDTDGEIEFIAHDSWDDGNEGVMAGSLDRNSGVLKFEKRDERIGTGCGNSSCGWSRHTRLRANLTMVGGEPSGLESLSYGFADAQETGFGARVVTAQGDRTSGIKARFYSISAPDAAALTDVANWGGAEEVYTSCGTGSGIDDSANCTGEDGIGLFTSDTKFLLYTGVGAHVSPSAWLSDYSGFDFDDVDLDVDEAF